MSTNTNLWAIRTEHTTLSCGDESVLWHLYREDDQRWSVALQMHLCSKSDPGNTMVRWGAVMANGLTHSGHRYYPGAPSEEEVLRDVVASLGATLVPRPNGPIAA